MGGSGGEPVTVFVPDRLKPLSVGNKVRIGNRSDGGYVVTEKTIAETDALAGLGVATDWSFEEDFFARKQGNIPIHCYDNRVTPLRFLEVSAGGLLGYVLPSRKAKRKRKSVFPKFVRFFILNPGVSLYHATIGIGAGTLGVIDVLKKFENKSAILLKMDIEGGEYDVLPEIRQSQEELIGAVIEFHDCTANMKRILEFVDDMSDSFCISHIEANNMGGIGRTGMPNVMTLTFERTALVERSAVPCAYPVDGLDFPNDPDAPLFRIEFVSDLPTEDTGKLH